MIGRCDFMKYNNNKGLFEGRKNLVFIISLIIMFFSSIVSTFAVSSYLYNSNEVSFNNNSSSSINSSNVQGAIDELYADAHNYEEMSGRVAELESYFTLSGFPQGRYLVLNNGNNSNDTSVRFMYGGKARGIVGLKGDGTMAINALNASEQLGQGTLELMGNPVKVNGNQVAVNWGKLNCGSYSGNTVAEKMVRCFKANNNNFPVDQAFIFATDVLGQRYVIGYVYSQRTYANFNVFNYDGESHTIRNSNGTWGYRQNTTSSSFTTVN